MQRENQQFLTINISTVTLAKILIAGVGIWLAYALSDVLAILFVATLLSSALSPLVNAMHTKGIPRGLGVLVIYIAIFSIFTFAITLLIPPLVEQYTQFAKAFPAYAERFMGIAQSMNPDVNVLEQLKKGFQAVESSLVQAAGGIFIKIFDFIKGIIAFFFVFVVTFYMIVQERAIKGAIHLVTPTRYRYYVDGLISQIQKKIGLWLRGQLILSFIIFLMVFIGLVALGVPYALILALVAGLAEFVPYIGPVLGSVPAIFIAFDQSPLLALWVVLLFLCIQRLENDFIVPRVMQKTIGINPLVSIIAILVGAKLAGFLGVLLAIPVTAILGVIIEDMIGTPEELAELVPKEVEK
ncbi:AI-2E family transporter [Candidatus Uhrbacteria bacterium]|nr:AI-2E family transporter [Candidatus Uhrbacteria bacterium]